ncbi:hypothetical protein [Algihabitans albus]|uniref:hypothetical protein n=1 Tax=Algihabitans albus TaxID=2164067 RepID=UPI0013C36263|nr:hypothetical protein [Algihabitans albus]
MSRRRPRRTRIQVFLTVAFACIALIGWLAWKGYLGETGPADPCIGLDGQEREDCLRRR